MTEPGAEAKPVTPPTDAAEEDLDSWRDDIALITPSGSSQWLLLPIAYVIGGVLAGIALLLVAHGRALNQQGWVFIAAAAIFILWGLSQIDVATFAVNVLEGTKPAFDTRKQIYDSFPLP